MTSPVHLVPRQKDNNAPNSDMALLLDVLPEIVRAIDVTRIIQLVNNAARNLVGADGATFVFREGDQCHYVDEDAIAPLWRGRRFPVEECMSGWAMVHRSQVSVADIDLDDRIPRDTYQPTFVRSLVVTPIQSSEVIGAIGVYWSTRHEATDLEQRLLRALADGAAASIARTQAYEELERQKVRETEQRRQSYRAYLNITNHILGDTSHTPLQMIADEARSLLEAPGAALLLCLSDGPDARIEALSGQHLIAAKGTTVSLAQIRCTAAVETGRPTIVSSDADDTEAPASSPVFSDDITTILAVPLIANNSTLGLLEFGFVGGEDLLDEEAIAAAAAFANYAAISLEYAAAVRAREQLAVLAERDRIGRDLHDDVIQRLFAAGMALQGTASALQGSPEADRLHQSIAHIDQTMTGLRGVIHNLQDRPRSAEASLPEVVEAVLTATEHLLPDRIVLRLHGTPEVVTDPIRLGAAESVLRESLTNIAKHSQATWVEISVRVTGQDSQLTIDIRDDGVGIPANLDRRSGLANMRARAEQLGGTFSIQSPTDNGHGTHLRWSIPVEGSDAAHEAPALPQNFA